MGAALPRLGAEVIAGPAALEVLRTDGPSAALLDIADARGHILLVAPTGWGNDEDRRRLGEAGIDHHLVKPVDLNILEGLLAARDEPRASDRN